MRTDQGSLRRSNAMAARSSIDVGALLGKQLEAASPDLLRDLLKTMVEALMSADADNACGADYGERSAERVNVLRRLPGPAVGHPGRDGGAGDRQAAAGLVLPGLAA